MSGAKSSTPSRRSGGVPVHSPGSHQCHGGRGHPALGCILLPRHPHYRMEVYVQLGSAEDRGVEAGDSGQHLPKPQGQGLHLRQRLHPTLQCGCEGFRLLRHHGDRAPGEQSVWHHRPARVGKHNGGDRAARCGVLAKAGPSYIPTSRGKRYLPMKGANTASPPRVSCATHWFLMGQLDVGKVDCLSWTLDWTKAVPVAWSSKRRGVEALSQSCAWLRLPGHVDASAVAPCKPWLLPHYALLWQGDGHWRSPRTRGQSTSGSRVQPAPEQALCAPVFSACGLLQPAAVGAIVRAEALEYLLRAGEGPTPHPHSVAWSFREKSLICSTGTSTGNKE
ncbi:V-set and transmembrane domain-containing protein 5 isoform X2 [Phocoena sinus]|uniref:V-set and transmembrane domain-containing protein 5 isoform X2 n=1 Tax=Phocoena sinus TaxID=42100 RepID=UPI0013C4005D|nr:V-set and transmembrane domain-containing protein 5 isoform X2 [Phocoena sinus]